MTEWISWAEASTLTGICTPTIEHAVRVGRIQRRPRQGQRASQQRESVLAWAAWYREQKETGHNAPVSKGDRDASSCG